MVKFCDFAYPHSKNVDLAANMPMRLASSFSVSNADARKSLSSSSDLSMNFSIIASRTRMDVGDRDIDDPGPVPFVRVADFIFFSISTTWHPICKFYTKLGMTHLKSKIFELDEQAVSR